MKSALYYEAHITLEPPANALMTQRLEFIAHHFHARVSTFLMRKPGDPVPDAFITYRGTDYAWMVRQTLGICEQLINSGLVIKRYKIEDTILDSKRKNVLSIPVTMEPAIANGVAKL